MLIPLHTFGTSGNATALAAALNTNSASGSGIGDGPYTTNDVTVTASGGNPAYTYLWTKVSGDTLSISSSTSATVNWSASGTAPSSLSAVWKCTVKDQTGRSVETSSVSVNVAFNVSDLAASLSTSSLSGSLTGNGSITTSSVSASPTGGTPGYTYSWTYVSGDTSIAVSSATDQTVTFSRTGTAGNTYSAIWQCVVTDSVSSVANAGTVSITMTFSVAPLSISLSDYSASAFSSTTGTITASPQIVATVSGGTGGYTYQWSYYSGDTGIYAGSPTSSSTYFLRFGSPTNTYVANWVCTVTDSSNNVSTSPSVGISIEFEY